MLRHGRTAWNEQHRIQGRTDVDLSFTGRKELQACQPHPGWLSLSWFSSPMVRALHTASTIGITDPEIEPNLIETNWGTFEGLTLSEINNEVRRQNIHPARGLDFLPPGGESPRMVRERLARWLAQRFDRPDETAVANIGCVTHKGVIRAAISLATGWDMEEKFPSEIDWQLPLHFERETGQPLKLVAVNLSWQVPPPDRTANTFFQYD